MPVQAVAARVEEFLRAALQPALLHPGDQPIALRAGSFRLQPHSRGLLIEAWDERRTLARRITAVESVSKGRLVLRFESFGGGNGLLELVDLQAPRAAPSLRSAARHLLRERLRRWLGRQFPAWRVHEITAGADLENTLSPVFPRALIRRGQSAWAVLAAPSAREHCDRALTFGLIWLDYLRRREKTPVLGLALFLPADAVAVTRLRTRHLTAPVEIFAYDDDGHEAAVDSSDNGNLIQDLPPASCTAAEPFLDHWARRVMLRGDVAAQARHGALSLQIRGLEFARLTGGAWYAGVDSPRRAHSEADLLAAAEELAALRAPGASDRNHPWYRRQPEAWLEQMVRSNPTAIDARLRSSPLYGQVIEWAACDRVVLDLLAIDSSGRLAVLELKASEDPHLPIQALDYWIQVRHHALSGAFSQAGYFPGLTVASLPPRLFLVAPALYFHPSTEAILSFFSKEVEVTRVGLAVEWQRELRVVMRACGAMRPDRQFS
ncbi:MAG: hypothetical protein HXY18_15290 [Bryobacteraceae bacterium]|nr:hypothetical protein [Bryobacteraceae bacterium]